jgi:general secretion pathway protein B
MSYILDALRRADAERERGAVPSLHAQQQFALGAGDGEPEGRPKTLWWVIAGLVAALVAVLAWKLLGGTPQDTAIAPPPTQPVATATPAAAPSAGGAAPPSATTPQPAGAAPPPGTTPPAAAAAPPPTARADIPQRTAAPRPPHRTARAPKATADDSAAADERSRRAVSRSEPRSPPRIETRTGEQAHTGNSTRRATPAAEAATPREPGRDRAAGSETRRAADAPRSAEPEGGRIVPQRELPEDVRRALPNFKVGGSAYSSDPSSRMLMINGQIFREGDAVAAGLVLKQIRPKAAVFEFRGYRYEMAF